MASLSSNVRQDKSCTDLMVGLWKYKISPHRKRWAAAVFATGASLYLGGIPLAIATVAGTGGYCYLSKPNVAQRMVNKFRDFLQPKPPESDSAPLPLPGLAPLTAKPSEPIARNLEELALQLSCALFPPTLGGFFRNQCHVLEELPVAIGKRLSEEQLISGDVETMLSGLEEDKKAALHDLVQLLRDDQPITPEVLATIQRFLNILGQDSFPEGINVQKVKELIALLCLHTVIRHIQMTPSADEGPVTEFVHSITAIYPEFTASQIEVFFANLIFKNSEYQRLLPKPLSLARDIEGIHLTFNLAAAPRVVTRYNEKSALAFPVLQAFFLNEPNVFAALPRSIASRLKEEQLISGNPEEILPQLSLSKRDAFYGLVQLLRGNQPFTPALLTTVGGFLSTLGQDGFPKGVNEQKAKELIALLQLYIIVSGAQKSPGISGTSLDTLVELVQQVNAQATTSVKFLKALGDLVFEGTSFMRELHTIRAIRTEGKPWPQHENIASNWGWLTLSEGKDIYQALGRTMSPLEPKIGTYHSQTSNFPDLSLPFQERLKFNSGPEFLVLENRSENVQIGGTGVRLNLGGIDGYESEYELFGVVMQDGSALVRRTNVAYVLHDLNCVEDPYCYYLLKEDEPSDAVIEKRFFTKAQLHADCFIYKKVPSLKENHV